MVDGDVFRMREAADAAELAAARFARKQTNNRQCCRGACQDTLPLSIVDKFLFRAPFWGNPCRKL